MKNILITGLLSFFILVPAAFANHPEMKAEIMKGDTNRDGSISKEEFLDSKEDKFEKADTNNDDRLSSAEIDEMIRDKKEKKKQS